MYHGMNPSAKMRIPSGVSLQYCPGVTTVTFNLTGGSWEVAAALLSHPYEFLLGNKYVIRNTDNIFLSVTNLTAGGTVELPLIGNIPEYNDDNLSQ